MTREELEDLRAFRELFALQEKGPHFAVASFAASHVRLLVAALDTAERERDVARALLLKVKKSEATHD